MRRCFALQREVVAQLPRAGCQQAGCCRRGQPLPPQAKKKHPVACVSCNLLDAPLKCERRLILRIFRKPQTGVGADAARRRRQLLGKAQHAREVCRFDVVCEQRAQRLKRAHTALQLRGNAPQRQTFGGSQQVAQRPAGRQKFFGHRIFLGWLFFRGRREAHLKNVAILYCVFAAFKPPLSGGLHRRLTAMLMQVGVSHNFRPNESRLQI